MPTYRVTPEMRRLRALRPYATRRPDPDDQPAPENLIGQEATERTLQYLNNPQPFGDLPS